MLCFYFLLYFINEICTVFLTVNTLPVVIDVGTDNEQMRQNPLYLGLRQPRLTGDEYFEVLSIQL
jgi:malate dehydrogenase (oxaloacetate-decarboxylating)